MRAFLRAEQLVRTYRLGETARADSQSARDLGCGGELQGAPGGDARTARHVGEEQALDHVFGYTILWDFSQRDPWGRGRQNTRNIRKGFDTFTGLGPWIVTRDEIDDPQDLAIRVEQNGKPAMSAHTGDMICTLREHIRFLSGVTTLKAGVLITTGTPAGVAKLADGDHLRGSIEKIGEMEVEVRAER